MKNISWWLILKLFADCTKVGFRSNSILFFIEFSKKKILDSIPMWELKQRIEMKHRIWFESNPKGIARKYSKKLKVRKKRQTNSRYTTPLFSEPLTYYTNSKITIGGNNNNLLGRFSFIYIIFIHHWMNNY